LKQRGSLSFHVCSQFSIAVATTNIFVIYFFLRFHASVMGYSVAGACCFINGDNFNFAADYFSSIYLSW